MASRDKGFLQVQDNFFLSVNALMRIFFEIFGLCFYFSFYVDVDKLDGYIYYEGNILEKGLGFCEEIKYRWFFKMLMKL